MHTRATHSASSPLGTGSLTRHACPNIACAPSHRRLLSPAFRRTHKCVYNREFPGTMDCTINRRAKKTLVDTRDPGKHACHALDRHSILIIIIIITGSLMQTREQRDEDPADEADSILGRGREEGRRLHGPPPLGPEQPRRSGRTPGPGREGEPGPPERQPPDAASPGSRATTLTDRSGVSLDAFSCHSRVFVCVTVCVPVSSSSSHDEDVCMCARKRRERTWIPCPNPSFFHSSPRSTFPGSSLHPFSYAFPFLCSPPPDDDCLFSPSRFLSGAPVLLALVTGSWFTIYWHNNNPTRRLPSMGMTTTCSAAGA